MCSTLKYYTNKTLTYYNHYYYYCCCCCYHIMKVVFKNRGQGLTHKENSLNSIHR
uniref:Uncharacterized protein n=1 Tax=Anguilla anguilla TaxID=7936 RepID=A0A0E9U4D9_ANGAN